MQTLRAADRYMLALTQHERDVIVIALRSRIEARSEDQVAITAGRILDRFEATGRARA